MLITSLMRIGAILKMLGRLQSSALSNNDDLSVPVTAVSKPSEGRLISMHNMVELTRTILDLLPASYGKEIVLPPILDPCF
jgi:hypothetical protein